MQLYLKLSRRRNFEEYLSFINFVSLQLHRVSLLVLGSNLQAYMKIKSIVTIKKKVSVIAAPFYNF
jgi:hypothetical protein